MKKFPFKKLDAFATQKSGGNPAGMITLNSADDLSHEEMLKIAQELEGFVTEVGYINQVDDETFNLRYYSAKKEVDFCGHATIAMMFDILSDDEILREKKQVFINTRKGTLAVNNRLTEENAVYVSAPKPVISKYVPDIKTIGQALGAMPEKLTGNVPPSVINAGLETLVVPVNGLNDILELAPDLDELKAFCIDNSIEIIALYTDEVADKHNSYRTRVFAPGFGYLEDPATGSGNSAIAYQLLEHDKWDGSFISLEQNGSRENPNIVKLGTKDSGNDHPQVVFGGGALIRISGEYLLL